MGWIGPPVPAGGRLFQTGTFRRPRCFSSIQSQLSISGPARSLPSPSPFLALANATHLRRRLAPCPTTPWNLSHPNPCSSGGEINRFPFFHSTHSINPFIAFTHNLWSKYRQPHSPDHTYCLQSSYFRIKSRLFHRLTRS